MADRRRGKEIAPSHTPSRKNQPQKSRRRLGEEDSFNFETFEEMEANNPLFYVPGNSFHPLLFINENHFREWRKDFDRAPVCKTRALAVDAFEEFGLAHLIRTQQWSNFVEMGDNYCPLLVKYFYANLTWAPTAKINSPNIELRTYLFGKYITFNVETMCELLQAPNNGLKVWHFGNAVFESEEPGALNVNEQYEAVIEKEIGASGTFTVSNLSPMALMVYHLVSRIIVPRDGNFSNPTRMNLWIMAHVVRGVPLNLGYLICMFMIKCRKNASKTVSSTLPYGSLITRILITHGIKIPRAINWSPIDHIYRASELTVLNIIRTPDGWQFKGRGTRHRVQTGPVMEEEEDEEEEAEDAPEEDAMDVEAPGSSIHRPASRRPKDAQALMLESLQRMELSQATLLEQVQSLHTRISDVETKFDSKFARLDSRVRTIQQYQQSLYERQLEEEDDYASEDDPPQAPPQ